MDSTSLPKGILCYQLHNLDLYAACDVTTDKTGTTAHDEPGRSAANRLHPAVMWWIQMSNPHLPENGGSEGAPTPNT